VHRTVITRFQPGHGFVLTGAAAESEVNDTAAGNFACGAQSARVVTVGNDHTYANLTSTALRFDTTGKYLAVTFRVSSALDARTLELEIANDAAFTRSYSWQFADRVANLGSGFTYDDEWEQIFLSFADAVTTGRPDRAGLTAIRLRAQDHGRPVTVHWQEVALVSDPGKRFPRGAATICFDDVYASQYTLARPVLAAHGFRGTVAVIRQAIGLESAMSLADLRSLQDEYGWEIGCHANTLAVHHETDIGVPLSAVVSDLRSELAFLRRSGFTGEKIHAYPSGRWNPAVLRAVSGYCGSARLDFFRTQETLPPADPYKLRACGSISSLPGGHSAAAVKRYIDAAAEHRSWLILIFHKIVTGTPAQRTECSLADFEAIVGHLAASGMPVLTTAEVMRHARSGELAVPS